MITLKEIASRSGVSIATVSNILNGKSNVSDDTKQRILQIIKDTGYKPNYMARGLRAAKTHTIGLLIDDLTEFSSPLIVDGIMSYLEENNYKAILENLRFYSKWNRDCNNEDYKHAVFDAFQEFSAIKVDGIIYVAGHARKINIIPEQFHIPTIISYAFTDSKNISSLMIDDFNGAREITEYLIDHGHSEIAVITGKPDNIHSIHRLEGYKDALKSHKIQYNEGLVLNGSWKSESGIECCKKLFESKKKFSAIFCFNDLMAVGVYKYLYRHQIKVGQDISVVGFDNRSIADELPPGLTTMEIPLSDIGQESAKEIIRLINLDSPDEVFKKKELYIKCNLIERDSVCKRGNN